MIFEAIVREAGVALSWHTNKLVSCWQERRLKKEKK